MSGATRIGVHDRITLLAPIRRVGAFEPGHLREGLRRNTEGLPGLGAIAGALAEKAPGEDGGQIVETLGAVGTIHVDVDGVPIAHLDRNVLVDANAVFDISTRVHGRVIAQPVEKQFVRIRRGR
jgi:hypothetical protein